MKRVFSLKGRNLFKEVYVKGLRVQDQGIQLIVLNYTDTLTKVGISINKKFGKAYQRNRAKRQIRAIFRDLIPEIKEGIYIIIRPNKNFEQLGFEKSKTVVKSLLKKAGAI